jgi:hypothetical protein
MDLSKPTELFSVAFPPTSRSDVDALDETLLPAIARSLQEEPTRPAVAARSPEILPLMDDLLADWTALALANERKEPEETVAQLRAVAQYASETLAELVQGMTWTVQAGSTAMVVKLSERDAGWSYCITFTNPGKKAVSEVRSTAPIPTKGAAREHAAAAVRELVASLES